MFLNYVEIKVLFVQATFRTKYFKMFFLNLLNLLLSLLYTSEQTWQGHFKHLAEIVVGVRWEAKH